MGALRVAENVLHVLDRAIVDGSRLTLVGQLDRKLYQAANQVIEAAGGRWDRKAKAHVFDGLAADAIEPILLTGEYSRTKQDFGQFDTPADLAQRVAVMADIKPSMAVLEPSCGIGNIVEAAERAGGRVMGFEIDAKRLHEAKERCIFAGGLRHSSFLAAEPETVFDRVVMNPPFARQDDIRHVMHAACFLKPGGRLVAIMSASVMFRDNRLTQDFRAFVATHGGTIERLPDGSFAQSGTSVNTCLVSFALPSEAGHG